MLYRTLALSTIFLGFACMKDGAWTKPCQLTTGITLAAGSGSVTYAVHNSGTVTLNTITYYQSGKKITVDKPALPFAVTVPVQANDSLGLQGIGTAIEGQLILRQTLIIGKDTTVAQDQCEG